MQEGLSIEHQSAEKRMDAGRCFGGVYEQEAIVRFDFHMRPSTASRYAFRQASVSMVYTTVRILPIPRFLRDGQ